MSSKPFTRSQARAAKHANNMEIINSIADELVERARAEFEKQLAEARAGIVRDLLRDGVEDGAYIECGVRFEGAYDKKLDLVIVCNMYRTVVRQCLARARYDGDCDCGECNGEECGKPDEESCCDFCGEPESDAESEAPKCPYSEFEYRVFTPPARQSRRIKEMKKRAVEAEIGAAKFAEWCATFRTHMASFDYAQTYEAGFYKKEGQLKAALAIYKHLLEAPESRVILRTFPQMVEVTRLKAEDLREHCHVLLNHMHAKCKCYDSYTRAQEDEFEALANQLISACGAYLDEC